jgi:Cu/Ag efflux pump CusA
MGIVAFALRYRHTFYVLALMMLFLGGSAILTAPKDIFPNINIPVVTVIWQYTGLTPEEMEQRVTTYSEYSISSNVSDIRNIESQTLSGVAVEKVFFQPNVNVDLAISQIVSASNAIRSLMPVGIQPPRHCPIQCFVGSGAPTELELRPAERAAALRLRHLPDTPGPGADRWHYAADPLWRQIPADHG